MFLTFYKKPFANCNSSTNQLTKKNNYNIVYYYQSQVIFVRCTSSSAT